MSKHPSNHIDPEKQSVETSAGTIAYEFCVAALGSRVCYYGVPGAKEHAFHLRSLPAAMDIQKRLVEELEEQTNTACTITVVGGGATGVELAGQLADLAMHDVKKYYPQHTLHIQLIHAAEALVPREDVRIQRAAEKYLKKAGVRLFLNMQVAEVTKNAVILSNKETLQSDMTIWAAGNEQKTGAYLNKDFADGARIPVNEFLQHKKFPSLYAVGDIAKEYGTKSGDPYPQLGEAAHREGIYAAEHIVQTILDKSTEPFAFKSLGTLIAIGDKRGIGKIGPFFFTGWFAWWMRRTVYVNFMPKMSRKIRIIIDWTLRLFGPRYIIDIEKNHTKT